MKIELYAPLSTVDLDSILSHNNLNKVSDIVLGQEYTMTARYGSIWHSENSPKLSEHIKNSIIAKVIIDSNQPELLLGKNNQYLNSRETSYKIYIDSVPEKD